jgi:hypothetical protein
MNESTKDVQDVEVTHFYPDKGEPPYWLRRGETEVEHHRRLIAAMEKLAREFRQLKERA